MRAHQSLREEDRVGAVRGACDDWGSDGGRRRYRLGDQLPTLYSERFRTGLGNELVVHPGVWNKVVVVAREDDDASALNHALIPSRRRCRI